MNPTIDLSNISVGIKTMYRTEKLERTLNALVGKGFAEIIVADDGEIPPEKEEFYEKFGQLLNLNLLKLPHDTGLSYGRNAMVKACKTEYIIILDDDQSVPENTHLLREIIESDEKIGGVSCYWFEHDQFVCRAYNLTIFEEMIFKDIGEKPAKKTLSGIEYYLMDFIPNSTLFRVSCLKEFPWDNNIKIAKEHIDFYLNHKLNSDWKFAVTPDVVIKHFPSNKDEKYMKKFRRDLKRNRYYSDYFYDKWKMRKLINGVCLYKNTASWLTKQIHEIIVKKQLGGLKYRVLKYFIYKANAEI